MAVRLLAAVLVSACISSVPGSAMGAAQAVPGQQLTVTIRRSSPPIGFGFEFVDSVTGARVEVGRFLGMEPSWSPDGRQLAYRFGNVIRIWSAATRQSRVLSTKRFTDERVDHPAWSPDGRQLAFHCYDDSLRDSICIMRLSDQRIRRLRTLDETAFIFDLQWSPSGDRIVYARTKGYDDGDVTIYDVSVRTGRIRQLTHPVGEDGDSSPSYSPDGRRIAYARCRGSIRVMDADGTRQRVLVRLGRRSCPVYLAWSPDGTVLAFAYSSARSVWLVNADGTGLRALLNGPDIRDVAWRRSG